MEESENFNNAKNAFSNSLLEICPDLTEKELEFILTKVSFTQIRSKTFYLQAGIVQESLGFVYSGLLRSYYLTADGKEVTTAFLSENNTATDYRSFIQQIPSKFYIKTLEPCIFINLSYNSIQECYSRFKNFEKYGRLIAEYLLIKRQNRIESFLFENAEQRYLNFIKNNPRLINRITLTHLSSFLGIERQSLTRIRKNI
ncbi:Crp/Fnr family transcriptional regulator [Gillisia sp. Hel_I_29]|uniref:Crp/Fnr family transcriptional regulator n=1 Tax=Gillisia sp. Hel_I_29 TaxID=1249975 RepID=UPI0005526479|nr:Crp/Fnr family transcriptional regulator [Gillisia sp. Hel_I_29]